MRPSLISTCRQLPLWVYVLVIIAITFLVPLGLRAFSIYYSHQNPIHNATVTLSDNSELHGELSFNWDRSLTITTPDGRIHHVTDYQMITHPVR